MLSGSPSGWRTSAASLRWDPLEPQTVLLDDLLTRRLRSPRRSCRTQADHPPDIRACVVRKRLDVRPRVGDRNIAGAVEHRQVPPSRLQDGRYRRDRASVDIARRPKQRCDQIELGPDVRLERALDHIVGTRRMLPDQSMQHARRWVNPDVPARPMMVQKRTCPASDVQHSLVRDIAEKSHHRLGFSSAFLVVERLVVEWRNRIIRRCRPELFAVDETRRWEWCAHRPIHHPVQVKDGVGAPAVLHAVAVRADGFDRPNKVPVVSPGFPEGVPVRIRRHGFRENPLLREQAQTNRPGKRRCIHDGGKMSSR